MFEWTGYASFATEEKETLGLFQSLLVARDHYLKPITGRIFPEKVALYLSGIQEWFRVKHPEYASVVAVNKSEGEKDVGGSKLEEVVDLDLSPLSRMAISELKYDCDEMLVESGQVLTNSFPIWEVDLSTAKLTLIDYTEGHYRFKLEITANLSHIFAFALHFEATFPASANGGHSGDGGGVVRISNPPVAGREKPHWKQVVFVKRKATRLFGEQRSEGGVVVKEYEEAVCAGDEIHGTFTFLRSDFVLRLFAVSTAKVVRKQPASGLPAKPVSHHSRPNFVQMSGDDDAELTSNNYSTTILHRMMIEDRPRTLAYKRAIEQNALRFKGRVVMDVGTGTGILAIFAARADAALVIAIDKSQMVRGAAAQIVALNNLSEKILVVGADVTQLNGEKLAELITDPKQKAIWERNERKVDIIVSEWMGYGLFYENMLPAVLKARDTFLKSDGLMFPDKATIHICAAQDWFRLNHKEFRLTTAEKNHGEGEVERIALNLSSLAQTNVSAINKHQHCMNIEKEQIISTCDVVWSGDFGDMTANGKYAVKYADWHIEDFHLRSAPRPVVEKQFTLHVLENAYAFGLITYFEVSFPAPPSEAPVVLSTAPSAERTHWKQVVDVREELLRSEIEETEGFLSFTSSSSFSSLESEDESKVDCGYFFKGDSDHEDESSKKSFKNPHHEQKVRAGDGCAITGTFSVTIYGNNANSRMHNVRVALGGECREGGAKVP